MSSIIVMKWKFSPPDYFESPIEIKRDNYTMTICSGEAEAKIDYVIYEANPLMREALHNDLESQFLGVMLYSHKPYDLHRQNITCVHDDGRIDRFLLAEPGRFKVTVSGIDFKITDKEGNVIRDTKQDKKIIADLITKHIADDIVLALLRSYKNSVRDPNNELIYLYEIRDAISDKLGGEKATISELKTISHDEWSRFGKLCNEVEVRQGRHRGKKYEELRDAREDELIMARSFAQALIEGYLRNLDKGTR